MPSSATNHGYRELARVVLVDGFAAALDGDAGAELWLKESSRAMLFSEVLDVNHSWLIEIFDKYRAEGVKPTFNITPGKRGRGRPKKVTSG